MKKRWYLPEIPVVKGKTVAEAFKKHQGHILTDLRALHGNTHQSLLNGQKLAPPGRIGRR